MDTAKGVLNKGIERAKGYHETAHEACHVRLKQKAALSTISHVSPMDILRYRYHHGTSLGSCFVLEKWITTSMFPESSDSSELVAVTASINKIGEAATKRKWEEHWNNMITDGDFDWLVNVAHCTSIRLPIGYWNIVSMTKGSPFEKVSPIYATAMLSIRNIISRAFARGIGTLIDVHGLPGGANKDEHSGTSSGKAELWGNKRNLYQAIHCIYLLIQDICKMDGVIGLSVCNEAEAEAPGLYEFYDRALKVTSQINSSLPIYISDAWDLQRAIKYSQSKNTHTDGHTNSPVVVDTHVYYCFDKVDTAKPPQQIIAEVPKKLIELDGHDGNVFDKGAAQVIVGEYSCVMAESTWSHASPSERQGLVKEFGQVQSRRWQQLGAGSYFWCMKMDWMDGGEWGFVEQTKIGSITPPKNLTLSAQEVLGQDGVARSKQGAIKASTLAEHHGYWNGASPGEKLDHWRFETGWDVGYSDARVFWTSRASGTLGKNCGVGGDKIGLLDLWVKKRIVESGMTGNQVWLFEHGLRRGISDFYDAAGV